MERTWRAMHDAAAALFVTEALVADALGIRPSGEAPQGLPIGISSTRLTSLARPQARWRARCPVLLFRRKPVPAFELLRGCCCRRLG